MIWIAEDVRYPGVESKFQLFYFWKTSQISYLYFSLVRFNQNLTFSIIPHLYAEKYLFSNIIFQDRRRYIFFSTIVQNLYCIL